MYNSLEEQIHAYKELARAIQHLEDEKKALGAAILQQMQDKSMKVGSYTVRRIERLSISVSLEDARILNATKMEESVDKDKIKILYQKGQQIPGVNEIKYIQVIE